MTDSYKEAASIIKNAGHVVGFTGAGISVESEIPPFRGEGGLWSKYDPTLLEISNFLSNPTESWRVIREIFFDRFVIAKPNEAHFLLAKMEEVGLLKSVITQNIDNLHQLAGSKTVHEFHGNSQRLICLDCPEIFFVADIDLAIIPPKCKSCGGLLKPDFIFFGEAIPEQAHAMSVKEANRADVFILIGTTGEVMPAAAIPHLAKMNGATIIEINPEKSNYTDTITDIYIQSKAVEAAANLGKELAIQ